MKYPVRIVSNEEELELFISSELQTYIVICKLVEKMNEIDEKAVINIEKKDGKKKLKEYKKILIKGKAFDEDEQEVIRAIFSEHLKEKVEFLEKKEKLGLHAIEKVFSKQINDDEVKFIRSSIRSGNRIEYSGSVVIIGDVNNGAEIIAAGNIVVTGILRGLAHSGATGNDKTFISANGNGNIQIRIADHIEEIKENEKPSIFEISEDKIIFQNLT